MHILLIHEFFLRPDEPGGERFNVMTRRWIERGARVTVIAGQTHYATGEKPPGGGLLDVREEPGLRVLRPWTPGHGRRSKAARMLGMAAFGVAATATLGKVDDWDVCVASSPSLGAWVAGVAAARRGPVVAEVRDLWPESAVTVGVLSPNHPATAAAYALEETMYETARQIVALTPGIRQRIIDRGLTRPDGISVMPNGSVPQRPTSEFERRSVRRQMGWEGRFVTIYAGAHGIANDLGQLVSAAGSYRDDPDPLFVFVGDGPRKAGLRRDAGPNVEWLEPVPHDELWALLGAADAGAVVLQANPTFRTVYPNKLFDYMNAGLPVLCGVEGDAADLVTAAQCGELVRPGDVSSWIAAIDAMRERSRRARLAMGARGRAFVAANFDRADIADAYFELLQECADRAQ